MSKKRKIIYILISLTLLIFSTISIAYASSIDDKYDNLEQYKSYMLDSNWLFANTSVMMNYLANFLFGISKALASITDYFIKALYQSDALNNIVDLLTDTSTTIYTNVFGKYGVLLFFIGMTIASVRYMVSAHRGVKDIFQLILLIGICTLWVTNAGSLIKGANDLSNDLQSTIATSGDKLVGNDEKLDGKDVLREKFFNQAVEQPFLLLNFNELDKEKINSNPNFKGKDGKSRIDSLLVQRDKKEEQTYLEENEFAKTKEYDSQIKDKQNYYISDEVVTHKLTVSFLSMIMNALLMLPFNLIAFFNFIIQIQIVFYVLVVPFTLLASYLPFMRMSYVSVFKNLLGLYALKAMLGLVILFVSLVMNLTRKIMETSQTSPVTIYSTSIILLVVSLLAMWKNRNKILATLSAGGISTSGITGVSGVISKTKDKLKGDKQEFEKTEQELKDLSEIDNTPIVRPTYNSDKVERTPQDKFIEDKELKEEQKEDKLNNLKGDKELKRTPQDKFIEDKEAKEEQEQIEFREKLDLGDNGLKRTPQGKFIEEQSESNYVEYKGEHNNINLTQDEYDKYLDKLDNDEERLRSIIDYASESKNNGLYENQSDSMRLDNIITKRKENNFKEQIIEEREIIKEDEEAHENMLKELKKKDS